MIIPCFSSDIPCTWQHTCGLTGSTSTSSCRWRERANDPGTLRSDSHESRFLWEVLRTKWLEHPESTKRLQWTECSGKHSSGGIPVKRSHTNINWAFFFSCEVQLLSASRNLTFSFVNTREHHVHIHTKSHVEEANIKNISLLPENRSIKYATQCIWILTQCCKACPVTAIPKLWTLVGGFRRRRNKLPWWLARCTGSNIFCIPV